MWKAHRSTTVHMFTYILPVVVVVFFLFSSQSRSTRRTHCLLVLHSVYCTLYASGHYNVLVASTVYTRKFAWAGLDIGPRITSNQQPTLCEVQLGPPMTHPRLVGSAHAHPFSMGTGYGYPVQDSASDTHLSRVAGRGTYRRLITY